MIMLGHRTRNLLPAHLRSTFGRLAVLPIVTAMGRGCVKTL